MVRYEDRIDAGRQLGRLLAPRIDGPAVVLAVPRAGVQVGAQVAEALHAPLLPLLVRKVGLPEQPDVVVGAIDPDGAMVFATGARDRGLLPGETENMGEDVAFRLRRWQEAFGAPDPATLVRTHVVVVVDDAVISGLTTRSGVGFLKRRGAEKIILAVPVGVDASLRRIEEMGVEVVCPHRVASAEEVPASYGHLPEVNAEEVAHLLARAGPSKPPGIGAHLQEERALRLVDGAAVAHRALFRIPVGPGPFPAMVLAGDGIEPGSPSGDALAVRLAEAGIASMRFDLHGGASEASVLELALDVLSARPEIDAYRLGILVRGAGAAEAGAEVASHDRRVGALVLLEPTAGLEPPDRCLVVAEGELDVKGVDRVARWLGERMRPV